MQQLPLALIGAAWGMGAPDHRCQFGPIALRDHTIFAEQLQCPSQWQACIETVADDITDHNNIIDHIQQNCQQLSTVVQACVAKQQPFLTVGGDHSCAIGSWYGALAALSYEKPFGLIWLDAHMDSHTFDTSTSQQIHGMPLACLLGYGDPMLIHLHTRRVLDPKRICLVGIRSFEVGESQLLKQLGIRIFYMDEIKQRGLEAVLNDAFALVKQDDSLYGISIDLDGFDPQQVPGVGSPEKDGIDVKHCCQLFKKWYCDPQRIGVEIAEYNPSRDLNNKTQQAIVDIVNSLFAKRS